MTPSAFLLAPARPIRLLAPARTVPRRRRPRPSSLPPIRASYTPPEPSTEARETNFGFSDTSKSYDESDPSVDLSHGPEADADEESVISFNRRLFPEHPSFTALNDLTVLTFPTPLGAALEETPAGIVFIDEVDPDANGAKAGLQVGDVVVAASLPYGPELVPLPEKDPLTFLGSLVDTCESDSFSVAVRRDESLADLRAAVAVADVPHMTLEEIQKAVNEINTDWYPFYEPVEEEEGRPKLGKNAFDYQKMVEAGFDMDVEIDYKPTEEDLNEIDDLDLELTVDRGEPDEETKAGIQHWRDLYEKGKSPSD